MSDSFGIQLQVSGDVWQHVKYMFNKIKTNNTTQKNFAYKKGDVNLSFTLRTDIKTELKDFVELLKVALKEVTDEINNG